MSNDVTDVGIKARAEYCAGPKHRYPGDSPADERAYFVMGFEEGARWMRLAIARRINQPAAGAGAKEE